MNLDERRARRGRVIENHETIRHAARFRETPTPIGRALQYAQTDDDIEGVRFELKLVRVAVKKVYADDICCRAAARFGEQRVAADHVCEQHSCSAATIEPMAPRKRRSSKRRTDSRSLASNVAVRRE